MRGGIRFGKVMGIPVVADVSAFVLALLFGLAVVIELNQADVASDKTANVVAGVVAGVAIILCIAAHELSHAVVARLSGLSVQEIRLFMFGGYSVVSGEATPREELAVAAFGPITSLALGGFFAAIPIFVDVGPVAESVLASLALANVAIAVFNLIPGFPLDGAWILRNVLTTSRRNRVAATRIVTSVGRYTGWVVAAVGAVLLYDRQAVGVVLVVAGYFMAKISVSSGHREELSAAFDGVVVSDIMRSTPEAVSGDWTISTMLNLHELGPRLRSLPVEIDGRVVGIIGQDEIDAIAPARWPSVRVRSLMTDIGPSDIVEWTDPLDSLLLRHGGEGGRAIVVRNNQVVGVVDGPSMEDALRRR